jgi:phage-related protein
VGAAWDLMKGAIDTVVNIIKGFIDNILKPAFDGLVGAANILKDGVITAWELIQGGIDAVVGVIDGIVDGLVETFDWMKTQVDNIVNGITGFFNDLINSAQDLWNKLTGWFSSLFTPLLENIQHVVNVAKDIWNGFVRFWNGFEIRIPAIKIGDFQITPELVFGLPDLPMLARGTNFFKGGLALVGERGPELAYLPTGTRVTPADKTRRMLDEERGHRVGLPPIVQHIYGVQPGDVTRETQRAFRYQAMRWQMEGRS